MGKVLKRFPGENTLNLKKGVDTYLYDDKGKEYLDMASNAMITNLGYSNPSIVNAMKIQAEKLCYTHNGRYTNDMQERLADKLSELAGGGYHVYFCSSGSEGIESALRITSIYHKSNNNEHKTKVVASSKSYHGSSLGSLSITGLGKIREDFKDSLKQHYFVDVFSGDKTNIEYYLDKKDTGACVIEPMSTNAAGSKMVTQEIMSLLRRKTKENKQILIYDEISTSIGRTGENFAFQHYLDIEPDIICLSKGIGVGYANIGAVLVKDHIAADVQKTGTPLLGHSYNGHPIGCAVGLEVLDKISKNSYIKSNKINGKYLLDELNSMVKASPYIEGVRGKGLMMSILLTENEGITNTGKKLSIAAYHELLNLGIITLPGSGAIDGFKGQHITISPPFTIKKRDIDVFLEKMNYFIAEFEDLILPEWEVTI